MTARDANSITCDHRAFAKSKCHITVPDRLGYYSKKENDRTQTISVDLKSDNASYLDTDVHSLQRNLTEPYSQDLNVTFDLRQGFDRSIPPLDVGHRLDNLFEWLVRTNRAKSLKHLWQVTLGADIVIDRSTLSDLGVLPQYSNWNKYAVELACMRIGHTVFVCPFENAEKKQHFDSEEQRLNYYRQAKFAQYVTKGRTSRQTVYSNRTYHHVLGTRLTDPGAPKKRQVIKVLYPAQIYALDGEDRENNTPVEIRCERHDFERNPTWYRKALKWYLQARFSGAEKILVGMRNDSELVGVTEVPVEWLRESAEAQGLWHANISFGFLHRLLDEIRFRMNDVPEGECLRVTHQPKSRVFSFAKMDTKGQTFLSVPLMQRYAPHFLPKSLH